jgi:hypothetical protein
MQPFTAKPLHKIRYLMIGVMQSINIALTASVQVVQLLTQMSAKE